VLDKAGGVVVIAAKVSRSDCEHVLKRDKSVIDLMPMLRSYSESTYVTVSVQVMVIAFKKLYKVAVDS